MLSKVKNFLQSSMTAIYNWMSRSPLKSHLGWKWQWKADFFFLAQQNPKLYNQSLKTYQDMTRKLIYSSQSAFSQHSLHFAILPLHQVVISRAHECSITCWLTLNLSMILIQGFASSCYHYLLFSVKSAEANLSELTVADSFCCIIWPT